MTSRDIELRVNRRNTLAFIAANPSEIVLIPAVKVKTASGGTRIEDGTPRAPQTLRLIDQSGPASSNPGVQSALDGKQRLVIFQLLGPYDAVIEVGDHWFIGTTRYEVTDVLPFNGYEIRAQVVKYG